MNRQIITTNTIYDLKAPSSRARQSFQTDCVDSEQLFALALKFETLKIEAVFSSGGQRTFEKLDAAKNKRRPSTAEIKTHLYHTESTVNLAVK